mgnify:FL=1
MENILITGISGQDGIFLTSVILKNNPTQNIYGITRQKNKKIFFNKLNTISNVDNQKVKLLNVDLNNLHETSKLIEDIRPDYIYNLSGPSSVYDSFINPNETKSQINSIFENLTSTLIKLGLFSNFYQASSSEMFGLHTEERLSEESTFNPNSPYAEAKLENHKKVLDFSQKYDWNIYSGIMFNHESQFREDRYLFMKIINGAIDIKNKKLKKLTVGSLDYIRDWSFAGDISKAIYAITNKGSSNAYVIGSGKGNSIKTVIEIIFDYFNLNLDKYIDVDKNLIRKGDPVSVVSNPKKLNHELGWDNTISFEDLIQICIESKINKF